MTPRYIQWTIPSLLYHTRRKNPLVHKGLICLPFFKGPSLRLKQLTVTDFQCYMKVLNLWILNPYSWPIPHPFKLYCNKLDVLLHQYNKELLRSCVHYSSNWMILVALLGTLVVLFPLMIKRHETPANYILLGAFVSMACTVLILA